MTQKPIIMTTVRISRDLHERLRQMAFDRRTSMHALLIEGARCVAEEAKQRRGTMTPAPNDSSPDADQ